jgi:thiol-disulfide isomerase/thioredoxin
VTWLGGIAAVLLLLFAAMQVVPRLQAHRAVGRTLTGVPGALGEAIGEGTSVLAVFSSPTCAACKAQAPAVDRLQREFPFIYAVNVIDQPAVARAFGILATPTTVLVQQHRVRAFRVGVQSEQNLRALLNSAASN